jgi:sugar fermentation stimulation protein A
MNDRIIEFDPLIEGVLIKRYKRFFADIKLNSGEVVTAHCANTGPMKGLLSEGAKVRISVLDAKNEEVWVGINTLFANKLIKKVIEKNLLNQIIGEIETIKPEVPYGKDKKSRIDFFLTPKSSNPDKRNIYIEVKNTTWIKENVALFPDTVTKRGQKHLIELKELLPESKSVLVLCITRKDACFFAPGDDADPLYGKLFRESSSEGMITIPCSFIFHKDHVSWNGIKPLK